MFSFFYTEKIANYMLENNKLYQEINKTKDNYEVASVNASIDGEYIVPGLNGQVVDVKNSYYNMKDIETFNAYYLMYNVTYPEISLNSNVDKIINKGNSEKRSVAFILEYDPTIISFFEDNNYPASVVVSKDTFSKNSKLEQLNEDICRDNSKYLVSTKKIINNSTIIDIKNNIESGDIYYVSKNTDTKSIQLIINSIIFKDLDIVKISELISEEYVD